MQFTVIYRVYFFDNASHDYEIRRTPDRAEAEGAFELARRSPRPDAEVRIDGVIFESYLEEELRAIDVPDRLGIHRF